MLARHRVSENLQEDPTGRGGVIKMELVFKRVLVGGGVPEPEAGFSALFEPLM